MIAPAEGPAPTGQRGAPGAKITEIEGIGEAHGQTLTAAGVETTEKLLEVAGAARGREALSASTGISERLILEWVDHADLMRVNGVGSEYADLLEAAGVDSPTELAQRTAANLATPSQEVVAARPSLVRRIPSEETVAGWIEQAKGLDQAVTHQARGPPAVRPRQVRHAATVRRWAQGAIVAG